MPHATTTGKSFAGLEEAASDTPPQSGGTSGEALTVFDRAEKGADRVIQASWQRDKQLWRHTQLLSEAQRVTRLSIGAVPGKRRAAAGNGP